MPGEPFPELVDIINHLGETMPDVGASLPQVGETIIHLGEPFPKVRGRVLQIGGGFPEVGEALPQRIMIFLKLEQGVATPCSDNLRPSHYPIVLFFSSLHSISFHF